jgi:hypothetical protein
MQNGGRLDSRLRGNDGSCVTRAIGAIRRIGSTEFVDFKVCIATGLVHFK